jgi:hypothetical protein
MDECFTRGQEMKRLPTIFLARLMLTILLLILTSQRIALSQDPVTGAFEGAVADARSGKPVPGAIVKFTNLATQVPVAKRTDAQGKFYQGLLQPGLYRVEVTASGYHKFTIQTRLIATRGNAVFLPIPILLEPEIVDGQHLSKTTAAIAVASMPNATIIVSSNDGKIFQNKMAPDQAVCVFERLPAGTYKVRAELEGHLPAAKEILLQTDKIQTLTLQLTPSENLLQVISQLGSFHALVIGNNNYRSIATLKTAENDAKEIAATLQDKYGFEAKLLLNANREQIIVALNEYRRKLTSKDNFLVYYAGHGHFDKDTEKAYWLPIDARAEDNAYWISADDITTNLKALAAKHIIVISDSCYSGTLTRAGIRTFATAARSGRSQFIEKMVEKKSRTLLASGGNEPVTDGGGSGHSVFAKALLSGLNEMSFEVFTADEIYDNFIRIGVGGNATQTPQYSRIPLAGDEAGDFVFVRKRK